MELLCDSPLEGEEFLFVGMIPLLGVIHNSTCISDRMVASISLFLRKNSPEAFTRRVRLEEERFVEVGKSQNGGLKTGRLKVFKSLKSFGGDPLALTFCPYSRHWSDHTGGRYSGEALNETSIMSDQANEGFHLRVRIWRRTLGDGLQVLL